MGLRDYQLDLEKDIYSAWKAGHKHVLAVMPTGMGKTRTFCTIAETMALSPSGPRMPTAIVVHRKELVQQICLTLAEMGIAHNVIAPRTVIKGIIAAERKMFNRQFYDYHAAVTVVSVDTLNARIITHEKWAKSIRLWIQDEATHVLKKNKWGRALDYFPDAIGLGVTATPQRLDKRGLGAHADGVFHTMVEGPRTMWGIEQGFLSKYRVAIADSDYKSYLKAANDGSDFTHAAMADAAKQSHIVGDVVKEYVKLASGKQAIVFASDMMSAAKMEAEFKVVGVSAKFLHGNSGDAERLNALIDYRDKKIQVLINIDLFDEGLDVPGIEVVIMARPTMSLGKYLQMIGRGLRPLKGKPFCIIIDHVGNVFRHGLPDKHRRWTLDRIVKRRDKTNFITICGNLSCNSPFDKINTECPFCGWKIPKPQKGEGGGRPGPIEVDGDLVLLDPDVLRAMEAKANLESPIEIGKRIGKAHGHAAGARAFDNQIERQAAQKELYEVIALWAGFQRDRGVSDRSIHKKFFLNSGMTMTEALSEPRAEMQRTIQTIRDDGRYW